MPTFGLIGKKLTHSFSKNYFSEKFNDLSLHDHHYNLYELDKIDEVEKLFKIKDLKGLNVTVPYKEAVIPYLDELDTSAKKVGAVNVISFKNSKKTGYNSDYYGFKKSLEEWLGNDLTEELQALVLGTGGASKAVTSALNDLNIPFKTISRDADKGNLTYKQVNGDLSHIKEYRLVINTTPLGMHPKTASSPDIPYQQLTTAHFLYDLVYNPKKTEFLKKGDAKGSKTKNGLDMLYLQAEKSWDIWTS